MSSQGSLELCPGCGKPPGLCVCDDLPKPPLKTRVQVLILQHPQESDERLGTGFLTQKALENASLKVGLSWPNLSKALGREATASRWAALYLGSGLKPDGSGTRPAPGLHLVDKRAVPLSPPLRPERDLDGLIVLDGTWSQAKAIWWRNAWLLKTRRAILVPSRKSLYGDLRREPRREAISTIESVAESLSAMGEPVATSEALIQLFAALIAKLRARKPR